MLDVVPLPKLKLGFLCFSMLFSLFGAFLAPMPVSGMGRHPVVDKVEPNFQKGMSFAAWWSGQYSDPGSDLALERLADTGTEWISLIVTGYQETPWSTTIDATSPSTPTDAELIHVINLAHKLGLKVMLKPHLDLRNEIENDWWRGEIGPDFTSEAQWVAWFASYRDFIEHYAQLAQTYGADQFCVGTELLGTTHRAEDWRQVVAGVRAIYDGPLVYAALHGGEETSITWWDAVDYIGVDAYYALTENRPPDYHPTVEQLETAWEEPKAILAQLSATYGKRILFTEIGYRSQHGCGCHPWDSWAASPVDLEEQTNAYEATFRQVYNEPWLAGIFWWTWYADRFKSGPYDDSFSPHLKPAEDVLRAWYGGAAREPQPILLADYGVEMEVYDEGLGSGWQDWSWGADVSLSRAAASSDGPALLVTLDPWGSLSFWHAAFSTADYHWLEFSVRAASTEEPKLAAFLHKAGGALLPSAPVNEPRHIPGGGIASDTWKRVRIPLSELNAHGDWVERINVQNDSSAGTSFWIDDLHLVGAREPAVQIFVPLVIR